MKLSSATIESIDWSSVEVLAGTGLDLKAALSTFVQAGDSQRASDAWRGLEGSAFAQDTIYGAAVEVVDVMFAALSDGPPDELRGWILEVLRFVLRGGAENGGGQLEAACRARASLGTWLLADGARRSGGRAEFEEWTGVLDLVDPEIASRVRGTIG